MENYKEMIEMFLPDKILNYFDIKSVRRVNDIITIRLIEKNEVPELPIEHRGKKISSKGFKDFLVDDFPLRGKRVKLELKRRIWQVNFSSFYTQHRKKGITHPMLSNKSFFKKIFAKILKM